MPKGDIENQPIDFKCMSEIYFCEGVNVTLYFSGNIVNISSISGKKAVS